MAQNAIFNFTDDQINRLINDPAYLQSQKDKRFCPHCKTELTKQYGCEINQLGACDGAKFEDGLDLNMVLDMELKHKQSDYNTLKLQIETIYQDPS
ncbi:hypothetical protein [Photobacterium sp. GB-72]|uniref:hypothetical protein n=1 Tax=Photobacterium sp. GB-72 TaxID=2022105 RepID=UPI000D177A51|nr:hypothetical protein [Photobacterium sp. GB-72]PSV27614.1 hypothetical protein C9J40_19970 [Photobacterium sp. GB-72]